MNRTVLTATQRRAWQAARIAWILLALLCFLWEWRIAPLRPGGSWLMLKAVPIALLARDVWRGMPRAMQWAVILVLLYLCESVVRSFDALVPAVLAATEIALALVFYVSAIVYLRPFKQAARANAKNLNETD